MLGVSSDATGDEIKKAYRAKAKELHSDLGGDDADFMALQRAYEILSDPNKRQEYDEAMVDGQPSVANPYLMPHEIVWLVSAGSSPRPTKIQLRNRGGLNIREYGPTRLSGAFWTIRLEQSVAVMRDDCLADFVIEPFAVDDMPVGTHRDELIFEVDSQSAVVPIVLTVRIRPTPPPPSPVPLRPPPRTPVNTVFNWHILWLSPAIWLAGWIVWNLVQLVVFFGFVKLTFPLFGLGTQWVDAGNENDTFLRISIFLSLAVVVYMLFSSRFEK